MPELNYPTLTVRTEYPGAAPEEVENEVSRPLEEALSVVSGLNKIASISRAGIGDVVMEFTWGTDMGDATQDVLERLDLVFLPEEAERPLILHFDPSLDPIMELSFSGDGEQFAGDAGLRRLRRLAEIQLKKELEPVKGVASVTVRGGLEEEIHVLVDEKALIRNNIAIDAVADRIRQENINVAGGTLEEGRSEYMVRTLNEYQDIKEIEETVVRRVEEAEVRVRDLGTVLYTQRDREMKTRTDGRESVQIDIYKEAEANIVAVAERVKSVLGEIHAQEVTEAEAKRKGPRTRLKRKGLAQRLHDEEGARLEIVADRSIFIESSINEVKNTAVIGGLLAVAILFLFLRDAKATAIAGVSIPMSLIMTFAPLNLSGVSLNIMSLGGLALGIGMLVDSSIVVLESIFRCREEGDSLRQAAIRGALEVRGAVIASTLTSIAVFFPLVFVEGLAGQAFGDLGLAVVISLSASLFVAVMFIPMLASRGGVAFDEVIVEQETIGWGEWPALGLFRETRESLSRSFFVLLWPYLLIRLWVSLVLDLLGKIALSLISLGSWLVGRLVYRGAGGLVAKALRWPLAKVGQLLEGLQNAYPKAIHWAVSHPSSVVILFFLTGYLTLWLAKGLDSELLPEVHQSEFTFEVSLPVGTPLEDTVAILSPVEDAILENKEDIRSVLVTFGYDVENIKRSDEGEHTARFKVLLEPGSTPELTESKVIERLRKYFERVPDITFQVVRPVLFSARTPIEIEVHGDDLARLKEMSRAAVRVLADLPELKDVETTLKTGAPEIQINYDRDSMMRFGLSINAVANQVRSMVKGTEATRFNMKDRKVPIVVRLEESDREYVHDIGQMVVNPSSPTPILLNSVANLDISEGPSEIRRIDAKRVGLVRANLGEASLGSAVSKIEETLRSELDWPSDMTFFITGQNEEWERSEKSLYLALGLSVFLVFVIMASQFESLIQPFIILVTVPLAFFGTMLGLAITNTSLSIVVFLGMIMLVGIVVNNAIVLIDYTNQLRERGMACCEAIEQAGMVRLRPILITTATTVLGLTPMALGLGDGAEIRTPMAIAVIWGLMMSTVLTLIVVPTFYSLVDRLLTFLLKKP